MDDSGWVRISDSFFAYYTVETKDMAEGDHVIYVRVYDGEEYSEVKNVIIRVDFGEDEGESLGSNELFLISFVLVIIGIVVGVLLYLIMVGRRRRISGFIRL